MVSRIATAITGVVVLVAAGCSSDTKSASDKPGKSPTSTPPDSETDTCDDNAVASASIPCKKDADPCNLHSGFAGDEYCIFPPPEGKGIQIHFGPKNYTDQDELA